MKGILGRKAGMTTVFSEAGKAIPVTVVEVKPNSVLQVKNIQKDGYNALKLGYEDKKISRVNKAELGVALKANSQPKYFIKEIRDMVVEEGQQIIEADIFEAGTFVDVTGTSKGKGFQGAIKRHNQSRGPMGHGSKYHRGTGSLGSIRETVKKTKKMPGHMGHTQVTVQNLEVVSVDRDLNVILVRGSIPGPNKSFVIIKEAIKKPNLKKDKVQLVDLKSYEEKNKLIEEGKKYNAALNSEMSLSQMKDAITEAKMKHDNEIKENKKLVAKALKLGINKDKVEKMKNAELKNEIKKIEDSLKSRKDNN